MNPRGLNLPSGQNTASCRGDFNKTPEQKRVLMCVFVVLGFEKNSLRLLSVRPIYKLQISVKNKMKVNSVCLKKVINIQNSNQKYKYMLRFCMLNHNVLDIQQIIIY